MALNPCVKAILCPLGSATLTALKSIIDAQVVFLQTQVTLITAQLVSLQIQLVPVQAVQALAETALAETQAVANLVPVQLINNCVDAGFSLQSLNDTFDSTRASVKRVLNEVNRKIALTLELEELRDSINAELAALLEFRLELDGCP